MADVVQMPDRREELRKRTKAFALRVIRLYRALPRNTEAQVIGKQVLRSGTSVGANYRAVCRARSQAEFAARMGVVAEGADETVFWLELLIDGGIMPEKRLKELLKEARELTAIFSASTQTARRR